MRLRPEIDDEHPQYNSYAQTRQPNPGLAPWS